MKKYKKKNKNKDNKKKDNFRINSKKKQKENIIINIIALNSDDKFIIINIFNIIINKDVVIIDKDFNNIINNNNKRGRIVELIYVTFSFFFLRLIKSLIRAFYVI